MTISSNLVHNVINVLIAIIAGLQTIDLTPFVSVETSLQIVSGLAILKLVINAIRDGITGMAKPQ